MGVRLPAEYQEVEYLEATGTQAFFTDVPIQDELTVDSIQTFAPNADTYLFGGYTSTGFRACFNGHYRDRLQSSYNGYYLWEYIRQDNTTTYHVVLTQRYGEQIGLVNGAEVFSDTRTGTPEPSGDGYAVAFGQRNSSGTINQWYKGKVYSLKVLKGNALLADYVPCYRKSDGEIGMFDLVLQKFYTNEGTGVFLKGSDVIDSISPWLVVRRRLLMRKPKLDTSPRIAQYGYGLSRSNTGITKVETNCYTEWYDVDPVATYQRTMTGSGVASGGANGSCFQTKTETGGNWDYWPNRRYLHANSISIRFSLITSEIDNAYVYCTSGGQIFFAGKNTPYYGYTNINDMPTGT